ncbi:type II toxin-antitoxin system HipA family toxin [Paraburkholderia sp. MMS20-SJTN17]|uniref:Type II toxin-antitoxin system HipA family toxin n=1 Tax=Paraburkholderia translucens TaxID=2886945 RepID=A0ABS8KLW3_9BURK|nr:type II toxin-antitoxin system HipA family toxin [Paraburkholderia sp. MMS20-SJTN17]MCC8405443.1 type II toxin-antitoxin system HipA family toxin [Paraburkholderia sp. MMS20-SJTN17]
MKLDVQVLGKNVATLFRERDDYVLKYNREASAADFVSLTMPVREEAWRWPRDLHPFFRQNLPEGYLLNLIREQFGPLLDGTDLSLLAVVGSMGIGRVTVTPEGVAPGTELQALDVQDILHGDNSAEHFAQLVREYARAAISGVVPKFIAPEKQAPDASTPVQLGKPTLRTSRHIVKGSDDNTPFLGFNEFYSMRVLERLGVAPVARTQMSDDGRALIVERFDVDAQGVPAYGVEDLCGLLGLPPHEKYNSTSEKMLNAARAYLLDRDTIREQLQQLCWQLLTNYVVRNADCHTKNVALFYTSVDDVAFTPVYDVVTTQAYPRFAANPPGLPIDGRKTWAAGKALERFFNTRMGIAPRQYGQMVEALCDSAVGVGHELIEAARNEPQWRTVAKQMLHAWDDGMTALRSPKKSLQFKGLKPAIEAAGFSAPEPPERSRQVIGHSPLLGRRN